jgi:hypothetical protein
VPRRAESSRIRRITVAPSMPGRTPSTTMAAGRHPQAVLAGLGTDHGEAGILERAPEQVAEDRAVIDHQDGLAGCALAHERGSRP